jgi:hydroxymethylpyrimidine/phosphomethylpyrimidine kinase
MIKEPIIEVVRRGGEPVPPERPKVLVVAGYDQSAGAGLLSDIKTLEAHGVYGYGVCTGVTFQNERVISRVEWFTQKDIFEQIDLCFGSTFFEWVKIGITPSMGMAGSIIDHIRQHNPGARVVLDPVIRASSGKEFWGGVGDRLAVGKEVGNRMVEEEGVRDRLAVEDEWEAVAARCYLLTPNWEEIGLLYPGEDIAARCRALTLQQYRHIYLKGGHHPDHPGRDYLFSNGEMLVLDPEEDSGVVYAKHGSGCVLSSSLTANLALGLPLPVAAVRSKRYIEQFLTSNKTLLGWHRPLEQLV